MVVQGTKTARRLPTGLVTFVMTDIEGSTRLFRERGDGYVRLLEAHHTLLTEAFASYRGVEIATEGDALVVVFDDAADALSGCVAGQLALSPTLGQPEPHPGADGSAPSRGHADGQQLRVTWPASGGTDMCCGAWRPDLAL